MKHYEYIEYFYKYFVAEGYMYNAHGNVKYLVTPADNRKYSIFSKRYKNYESVCLVNATIFNMLMPSVTFVLKNSLEDKIWHMIYIDFEILKHEGLLSHEIITMEEYNEYGQRMKSHTGNLKNLVYGSAIIELTSKVFGEDSKEYETIVALKNRTP